MLLRPGFLSNRLIAGLLLCSLTSTAQEFYPVTLKKESWHGQQRTLRYHPEGEDFVITNGSRRFNRALYGTNTAFRVEAGDLPEFAFFMPGMGGNLKMGLSKGGKSIWLINAQQVVARYTPGKMSYEISDPILGKSVFHVVVLAMAGAEGMVMKTWLEGSSPGTSLIYAFGGASGKKFSRSGDMGPDPESSFYLHPEDCVSNSYQLNHDSFSLKYGKDQTSVLAGIFPAELKLSDARQMANPVQFYQAHAAGQPVLAGRKSLMPNHDLYVVIKHPEAGESLSYTGTALIFEQAEQARQKIAGRIKVDTPDPYINTIGGALSIASDAIWESPSYLHGAIGWRMRLNGWRGPYTADPLGWHDRAQQHFESYAQSQVQSPLSGPAVADTAFHLARQQEKMGTSLFSSGYISRDPEGKSIRPHHYDMNLVYIDALLWHFNWTGDLAFAKRMWPVIQRHLAWEKRNFDPDNDGLYDAYAAIWASDALYYNGGAVTHSSAYNYRANLEAAKLASLIGEPALAYQNEAAKILKAMNAALWMPEKGTYAEYKDGMGLKSLHPAAALWTIYHAIDEGVADAFQAYQSLREVDQEIPHIPLIAKGLPDGRFYTLATSKWMPYTWSLNNVAMAESMHTALANWEAGRNEEGFNLFKSEVLADMYMGGSPANFVQISYYDAYRGEAYRDFGDPIGISSRALVEGLFGIVPDALHQSLTIRPGFPQVWDHASIQLPDLDFKFTRKGNLDEYLLKPSFAVPMALKLHLRVNGAGVGLITVNGEKVEWKNNFQALADPAIEINAAAAAEYKVRITWKGKKFSKPALSAVYAIGDTFQLGFDQQVKVIGLNDPQHVFTAIKFDGARFKGRLTGKPGNRSAFLQLRYNDFTWWYPVCFDLKEPVAMVPAIQQEKTRLLFSVINCSDHALKGNLRLNGFKRKIVLKANENTGIISIGSPYIHTGTNRVVFTDNHGHTTKTDLLNWAFEEPQQINQRTVDLSPYFNDKVTQIFKNKYLSPRPKTATLQIPWQGIGDWPHALEMANIDDVGLRRLAAKGNEFFLPQGIKLATPADPALNNIVFTSRWDNYPAEKEISLTGKAGHAYFLLAGSTNPMQSQFDNGKLTISYTDGSSSTLLLRNPETWWPIEQDYYTDGFAFSLKAARPPRLHLKTGKVFLEQQNGLKPDQQLIDGGAATVFDMVLDRHKRLKSLRLTTLANDVVIGLLSVTLTDD